MAGYGVEFPKEEDYHGHPNYLMVFIYLLVLLAISIVAGYLLPIGPAVAVIFVAAVIKAALVVANFMHLKYEPKMVWLGLGAFVFIVVALYLGVYPDIPIVDLEVAK